MDYKTGTLVEFRSRPWVVQQSSDKDLLVIKPLGGTDAETIGLYKPLYGDKLDSTVSSYNFRKPSPEDVGVNSYPEAARILYNACRLSFRDVAGPFQCLGKLSFEPRPYQMVPLILALKHKLIRLLISDDVGIGKTLESLLITKELLDRREIQRFAVICLPHLCEQWQNEIRDKFGLEAEIIRSSTISRLEKNMRANQSVFRDIPFQIISIDYIKSSDRKPMFLQHCPEFIIVDEAHTCAKPKGANKGQQLRHSLLSDLANTERHIVLLTATPHSGNSEEFQSVIGLLKPEFRNFTLEDAKQREELSHYFIQRRRADVKPYFLRASDKKGMVRISFTSPTPKNYMYIGRNHVFVEDLSRAVVNDTINGGDLGACRGMVIQTDKVQTVTTVLLMRVRSVISEAKHSDRQLVGEEMIFLGYKGKVENHDFLPEEECRSLFLESQATGDIDLVTQRNTFKRRLEWVADETTLRRHTDDIATERANNLVRSFAQYRTYLSEAEYQVVRPVLPMDVIAAFVYMPKVPQL